MCASTCMLPSSACPLVAHASAAPNRSMLVFARGVASPPTLLTPLPPPPRYAPNLHNQVCQDGAAAAAVHPALED